MNALSSPNYGDVEAMWKRMWVPIEEPAVWVVGGRVALQLAVAAGDDKVALKRMRGEMRYRRQYERRGTRKG